MRFLAAVTLPLYALDQLTKWWIFTHFALVPSERNMARFPDAVAETAHLPAGQEVIPGWFQIVHWGNTGAAFSILSDHPWVFVALSTVVLTGLLIAWKRNAFADAVSRLAVALLLAGILGNLTDRLVHGYVVDFLLVDLHVRFANPWPAFNVADSCICVAAALLVVGAIREGLQRR
jgi:signal peptidase II